MENTHFTFQKNRQREILKKEVAPPVKHSFIPEALERKTPNFLRWIIPLLCVGLFALTPEKGLAQVCPSGVSPVCNIVGITGGGNSSSTPLATCQIGPDGDENCAGFEIMDFIPGGTVTFDTGPNNSCTINPTCVGTWWEITTAGGPTCNGGTTCVDGQVLNIPIDATEVIIYVCKKNTGDVNICNVVVTPACTPPGITCPGDMTIECTESTDPAVNNSLGMATATGTNNCLPVNISFDDDPQNLSGCGTITRTWTATDANDDSAICSQIITVVDSEAPVVTCPAGGTLSCNPDPSAYAPGTATATDNCGVTADVMVNEGTKTCTPDANGCSTCTITHTYYVTDDCSNTSEPCRQTFTWTEDLVPPDITCPPTAIIECDLIIIRSIGYNHTGMATATDNCSAPDEIEITSMDAYGPEGCFQDITRTWTAEDACGNTNVCEQTISIRDRTPPEIVDCPMDVTIECDEDSSPSFTGEATATDNCDDEPRVTFGDVSTQGNTGCSQYQYSITRTWTATDDCGNTDECVQTISVRDRTPPVFTNCPAGSTVECKYEVPDCNPSDAMATDNCDDNVRITCDKGPLIGGPCGGTITKTYIAMDDCGNTAQCEQVYVVKNITPPVIHSILPDCYKYCEEMFNPQPSDVEYWTNCHLRAWVDITHYDEKGDRNCPGREVTYQYVVRDECGLLSDPAYRTFKIMNDGPQITCPPFNLILQCGDPNNQDYIDAHLGLVTATSSCDLDVDVDYYPFNLDLTACGEARVVTFKATDACGRTATCTTTIAVRDDKKPYFTEIPPRICDVIECGADANYWYDHWINYMLDGLKAKDKCDPYVDITADDTPLNEVCDDYGSAVTVVTFRATDDCDNYKTITATFTIVNEHPALFHDVPADMTVGCNDPIEFGPAPTITEECQTTVEESDEVDDSDPCAIKHIRTWTATDDCGGLSTYVKQTITEVDNEDPYFTFVPESFESGCINLDGVITTYAQICSSSDDAEENAMNGEMDLLSSDLEMVIDDSQDKEVKVGLRFKDLYIPKGAKITKAWIQFTADATIDIDPSELTINGFAGDNAMTFSETNNNITNRPKTNAVVSWEPADWMVVGDNHEPQRTPDLSAIVQEIVDRAGYTDQSALGFVVCGTGKRTAISYDLNPYQAPEIYVKYEVTGTFGTAEAADDCGDVDITYSDAHASSVKGTLSGDQEVPPSGSAGTGTVSGTMDANTGALTLHISFSGLSGNTTAAHIHSAPAGSNGGVSVNLGPLGLPLGVTSGGFTAETALSAEQVANMMAGNMYVNVHTEAVPSGELRAQLTVSDCDGSITRTWVATDDCGNTATASQTIYFFDHVPPVFTYVPPHVNAACEDLDFPLTFGTPEVYDNCGGYTITYEDYFVTGNADSCNEDDEDSDFRRKWTATDCCGNKTTAVQRFNIKESLALSGFVVTESNQTVEGVSIVLEGVGGFTQTVQTLEDGFYGFEDLALGQNYSVTPYLDEDPLNGVSSFDMVFISKHILQVEDLNTPYKMIAADVNGSGSVTTQDLLELRKVILHVSESFPNNNTSWRFVMSDFAFPNQDNPFASYFPEMLDINALALEEQHDFVAIKVGDVTGNAETNGFAGGADDRTFVDELVFSIDDQKLKAGETYEVTFRADNFEAMHGYQFSLNFDPTLVSFAGLSAGELINLKDNNFGLALLDEGVITTSWTNQNAHTVATDTELFHISFTAKADVKVSDVIHVSSQYTKAEAYNDHMELMDVQLRFEEGEVLTNDFRLYQNTPNPFKQETLIGFELPEASKATLNVYDVSGKLLKKVEGDFAKGYNSLSLTQEGLSSGLLYYQLLTPTHTATKKMMMH